MAMTAHAGQSIGANTDTSCSEEWRLSLRSLLALILCAGDWAAQVMRVRERDSV